MSIKRCQDKYGNVNLKSILCLIFLVVSEHLDVDFAQHAIFFKTFGKSVVNINQSSLSYIGHLYCPALCIAN